MSACLEALQLALALAGEAKTCLVYLRHIINLACHGGNDAIPPGDEEGIRGFLAGGPPELLTGLSVTPRRHARPPPLRLSEGGFEAPIVGGVVSNQPVRTRRASVLMRTNPLATSGSILDNDTGRSTKPIL